MNSCQGPCLKHCYAKNSLVLIFLGLIVGMLLNSFIFNSKKDNNSIII